MHPNCISHSGNPAADSNFTDFYLAYRGLFSKTELKELINDEKMRQEILSINIADYMPQIPKDITDKQKVSILEVSRYLGMQLLPDSDKFSMAHALELRTPFVDHVLAENLSKIDSKFFYNQKNAPKALLVDAFGDIPDEIVYRKKQGFTLPFGKWIKDDVWEVKSDFLNKATCKEINDSFLSNKMHWSRSWAIEILDRCLLKQR